MLPAAPRDVIRQGAEQLGWELDKLLSMTLEAMKACESEIGDRLRRSVTNQTVPIPSALV